MILQRLSLFNFRNYEQAEFSFGTGVNALIGANGCGKTNVLDAIHYLCLCKSYFHTIDAPSLRFGSNFFTVSGTFERGDTTDEIVVTVKNGQKKSIKRNQKEYGRLKDHIGLLPVVMEAPIDQEIIHGGSEERRRMMDSVICQYDHDYLDNLMAYNRLLQQRNAMLKQVARGGSSDSSLWQVWDEQLAHYGHCVYEARKTFVKRFQPYFESRYNSLASHRESAGITYVSHLDDSPLTVLLDKNLQKDLVVQHTSCGIHKDDLQLTMNGQPIRRYGSQGQQKSLVLALKLAQFTVMKESVETTPILLLDDVFDKLDVVRITRLMDLVTSEGFGQIILTDTQEEHVSEIFKKIGMPLQLYPLAPVAAE
jgi:DNA replication and repair protein RecF